jgi:hypothetical protein
VPESIALVGPSALLLLQAVSAGAPAFCLGALGLLGGVARLVQKIGELSDGGVLEQVHKLDFL